MLGCVALLLGCAWVLVVSRARQAGHIGKTLDDDDMLMCIVVVHLRYPHWEAALAVAVWVGRMGHLLSGAVLASVCGASSCCVVCWQAGEMVHCQSLAVLREGVHHAHTSR